MWLERSEVDVLLYLDSLIVCIFMKVFNQTTIALM